MTERRCETCANWTRWAGIETMGTCCVVMLSAIPVPFWAHENRPTNEKQGEDCDTWEARREQ